MAEMQGKTMAMPADGRIACCAEANEKKGHRTSPAGLSWYFAQRALPGLIYAATMNGYVVSGPYKTKGDNGNV